MKVINLQNYGVIVINTELTKIAIEKLAKHNPKALKLIDEEGNETFAIAFGEAAVSDYGICFDRVDSEGKALISISATMTNEELAEEFATVLVNAKLVETQAKEAYRTLEGQLLEIVNSIENPLDVTPERGEE